MVVFPRAVVNTNCMAKTGGIVNYVHVVDLNRVLEEGVHVCMCTIFNSENRIPKCMGIEAGKVVENRTYPL